MQLRHLIKEQLKSIAESAEPSGSTYHHSRDLTMPLKNRLLSVFDQCADLPMLVFDLHRHEVDEWVKLSAAAIRCTIAPCTRGFVFVSFGNSVKQMWHATVFYFDGDRQYFLNPSGILKGNKMHDGTNVFQYFQSHHMWIPQSRRSERDSLVHCVNAGLYVRKDHGKF